MMRCRWGGFRSLLPFLVGATVIVGAVMPCSATAGVATGEAAVDLGGGPSLGGGVTDPALARWMANPGDDGAGRAAAVESPAGAALYLALRGPDADDFVDGFVEVVAAGESGGTGELAFLLHHLRRPPRGDWVVSCTVDSSEDEQTPDVDVSTEASEDPQTFVETGLARAAWKAVERRRWRLAMACAQGIQDVFMRLALVRRLVDRAGSDLPGELRERLMGYLSAQGPAIAQEGCVEELTALALALGVRTELLKWVTAGDVDTGAFEACVRQLHQRGWAAESTQTRGLAVPPKRTVDPARSPVPWKRTMSPG